MAEVHAVAGGEQLRRHRLGPAGPARLCALLGALLAGCAVEGPPAPQRSAEAVQADIEALLRSGEMDFTARLGEIDGVKLAGSKDFDPDTGELRNADRRHHLGDAEAATFAAAAAAHVPWRVAAVTRKETTQRPSPPFTTSTLQQAASGRLRMTPQRVMRIAQRLYEGIGGFREGLITYMRTDSLTLSEKFLAETDVHVRDAFGETYTEGPRRYKTKSKGAQEAHEAIRPTDVNRTPEKVKGRLDGDELAVYTLIWNRAVASQMANAR